MLVSFLAAKKRKEGKETTISGCVRDTQSGWKPDIASSLMPVIPSQRDHNGLTVSVCEKSLAQGTSCIVIISKYYHSFHILEICAVLPSSCTNIALAVFPVRPTSVTSGIAVEL